MLKKRSRAVSSKHGPNGHPYDDFLAFCNACRKKLGQGKDIFMHRGDQAFCSQECRNREMFLDDGMDNSAHCRPPAPYSPSNSVL